jgi:Tetratricopeptide repeat
VFLGYSETLLGPTDRLRVERLGDAYGLRALPPGTPPRPRGAQPRPPAPSRPAPADAAATGGAGEAVAMAAAGEAAAARGDPGAAVTAFRKAVFLDPDQPGAWFQLGLALEAVPDPRGAHRAYAAALAALGRCDPGAVRTGLDGWPPDQLAGVLRARLDRPAAAPPRRSGGPGP